jgi:hypothetical protein
MSRKGCCLDCDLPASAFGLDLWLPGWLWRIINPTPDGLLCANCMLRRLKMVCPDVQGVLGQLSTSFEEIRAHANQMDGSSHRL